MNKHTEEVKFFPKDFVSSDWEPCKIIYSIEEGNTKNRPTRLLTEQPEKYFIGTLMFDLVDKKVKYLPGCIYKTYPERYISLKSQQYKDMKTNNLI
jgi:hypothetical protein